MLRGPPVSGTLDKTSVIRPNRCILTRFNIIGYRRDVKRSQILVLAQGAGAGAGEHVLILGDRDYQRRRGLSGPMVFQDNLSHSPSALSLADLAAIDPKAPLVLSGTVPRLHSARAARIAFTLLCRRLDREWHERSRIDPPLDPAPAVEFQVLDAVETESGQYHAIEISGRPMIIRRYEETELFPYGLAQISRRMDKCGQPGISSAITLPWTNLADVVAAFDGEPDIDTGDAELDRRGLIKFLAALYERPQESVFQRLDRGRRDRFAQPAPVAPQPKPPETSATSSTSSKTANAERQLDAMRAKNAARMRAKRREQRLAAGLPADRAVGRPRVYSDEDPLERARARKRAWARRQAQARNT